MTQKEIQYLALTIYFFNKWNDSNPEVGWNDPIKRFQNLMSLLHINLPLEDIKEANDYLKSGGV